MIESSRPPQISYAQCWEDADVLLAALDMGTGDVCLSIASGGDNTLALLAKDPAHVIAVDINPAQLACLELRIAAYRALSHAELLELLGSSPSERRPILYRRCRAELPPAARRLWDERPQAIASGVGACGRFERYLAVFRERVLPLAQSEQTVARLLQGGRADERERLYAQRWDNWRWRLLFRLFFSRWALARFGRDAGCFRHAPGDVAAQLLARTRYALTVLDPAQNPYLHWICTGRHLTALPYALRAENFAAIRDRLDRLELRCEPLEQTLGRIAKGSIDRFNLSDIFEYMAPTDYQRQLTRIAEAGHAGTRLAYWNLLAPRSRPECMATRLRPLAELAEALHSRDQTFFYRALVIEEVQ